MYVSSRDLVAPLALIRDTLDEVTYSSWKGRAHVSACIMSVHKELRKAVLDKVQGPQHIKDVMLRTSFLSAQLFGPVPPSLLDALNPVAAQYQANVLKVVGTSNRARPLKYTSVAPSMATKKVIKAWTPASQRAGPSCSIQ